MKEIVVRNQAEFDAIKEVPVDTCLRIVAAIRFTTTLQVFGRLIIEVGCDMAWGRHAVLRGSSHAEAFGWAMLRLFGTSVTATVAASVMVYLHDGAKCKGGKTLIARALNWFTHNGVKKAKTVMLYKRVSHDFKTQEGTKNETLWVVGSTVTHPAWRPKDEECGEGKFHACSRAFFADEFRDTTGDKYVAIEVASRDLYAWPKPTYPHKIAFRAGKVLHQCDRMGNKMEAK